MGRVIEGLKRGWILRVLFGIVAIAAMIVACAEPIDPTLTVSPDAPTLIAGQAEQLIVLRRYPHGSLDDVSGYVRYASSNEAIAKVDDRGLVTAGQQPGTAVIRVTDPDSSVTVAATVRVTPLPIVALEVSPGSASLVVGGSQAFTAAARYADGTSRDVTAEVAWSSSNGSVASVGTSAPNVGLVTALSAGATTVIATHPSSAVQGHASVSVRVNAPQLVALVVTPNPARGLVGSITAMNALGVFSDGSSRDLTTGVTWTSSAPAIATIDDAGKVTSVTTGATTITATGKEPNTVVRASAAFTVE